MRMRRELGCYQDVLMKSLSPLPNPRTFYYIYFLVMLSMDVNASGFVAAGDATPRT